MKVRFSVPFYHNELGLIPRKQDGVGAVIEVDDKLISVLPVRNLELIEATDGQRKIYAKRVEAAKQKIYQAKTRANQEEAQKQTDLLVTLVSSLKDLKVPVAQDTASKEPTAPSKE